MTSGSGSGWPDVIKVPAQKVVHDPLCKQRFDPYQPPCPECEILATARADEREHTAFLHEALLRNQLADLRARVEALRTNDSRLVVYDEAVDDMLALIDGATDD